MTERKLIRVREAAKRFGVSAQTLREYVSQGKVALIPVRLSNRVMFDEAQVNAVLASLTADSSEVAANV